MATNDITLYIPPTEEEVMLIQPNNVTFGQYSVTEWQENLLTLISDQIQQHMTREKQLPKDLFNQPVVEIKCDEAGGKNNKSKVLKEAIAMMRKNFSFRWVHPNIHQTVETFGVVITTVHNIKGTNRVALTLNPWAIPFLLYYGTGVGGTRYGKNIALTSGAITPSGSTRSFAANGTDGSIITRSTNSAKTWRSRPPTRMHRSTKRF